MKVFLTGGTGFIGQPLTKVLLTRGWSVTALVCKPNTPQAQGLSKIGAQLSTGDVTEYVIVCPHGVIGANDHSSWGYFLRLYLNHIMPPTCWSPNLIQAPVYIDDLVEGITLAAEKGRIGEMYFLSGEATSLLAVPDVR
jgi:nucleoside-diphosphate-sugar epimerase